MEDYRYDVDPYGEENWDPIDNRGQYYYDLIHMCGIDRVQEMENELIESLSKTINENILSRLRELGKNKI